MHMYHFASQVGSILITISIHYYHCCSSSGYRVYSIEVTVGIGTAIYL